MTKYMIIIEWFNCLCSYRDLPTKLDREVFLAIEGLDVDPQKFPSIHKWKSTMKSYSTSDMQRLVSMAFDCNAYYLSSDFTVC